MKRIIVLLYVMSSCIAIWAETEIEKKIRQDSESTKNYEQAKENLAKEASLKAKVKKLTDAKFKVKQLTDKKIKLESQIIKKNAFINKARSNDSNNLTANKSYTRLSTELDILKKELAETETALATAQSALNSLQ